MTVEITMSDDEYKFISKYAATKNLTVEEIFLKTVLDKIRDEKLLAISDEIIAQRAKVYEALAK